MNFDDIKDIDRTVNRAVIDVALGRYPRAYQALKPLLGTMAVQVTIVVGLARHIPDSAEVHRLERVLEMPATRFADAAPAVPLVHDLASAFQYGGLYQVWSQFEERQARDVCLLMLAMAGLAQRHPEWN